MVGAKGFEPSTSWSRTKYLNPINALSGVAYGTRTVISPLLVVRNLYLSQEGFLNPPTLRQSELSGRSRSCSVACARFQNVIVDLSQRSPPGKRRGLERTAIIKNNLSYDDHPRRDSAITPFVHSRGRSLYLVSSLCMRGLRSRRPMDLHTIGIDLGKTVFHLVGLNLHGEVVVRRSSRASPPTYTSS